MTLLMPADALRLGVNFNDPKLLRAPLNGVGGAAAGVVLQSVIAFAGNSGNVYVYQTMIFAAEPSPQIKDVPSLLGRNIIDQWEVTYAPKSIGLTAKILSADFTLPTRPQNTGP